MVMRVPREHPVLGKAELLSWGGELFGGVLDRCALGSLTGVLASPSGCPHEASGPHRGGRGQRGSRGSQSLAAALGAPRAVLATRAQPQGLFLHWGFWQAVGARGLGGIASRAGRRLGAALGRQVCVGVCWPPAPLALEPSVCSADLPHGPSCLCLTVTSLGLSDEPSSGSTWSSSSSWCPWARTAHATPH